MATNPPIVIGPFANVPAAGSGVRSDWAQQITNYVLRTTWTAVTFTGGWINFGAPAQACQYRKVGDTVELRGLMKSGTIGSAAFTLPAGFRPPANVSFAALSNGAFGFLSVDSAGVATPISGSPTTFSIQASFSTVA